jgi:cytochrome bd-type quinol oxidase subunit 2
MYQTLLVFHSITRWVVLTTLLISICRAYAGFIQNKSFSKSDNALRHWTATVAHIQLIIGILLYIKSPVIKYFFGNINEALKDMDTSFFGLYHILLMILSVVLVTIGSALAKRKKTDKEKYKTMLVWFSISLLIIFIAIPWPFSPFANRPYIRAL